MKKALVLTLAILFIGVSVAMVSTAQENPAPKPDAGKEAKMPDDQIHRGRGGAGADGQRGHGQGQGPGQGQGRSQMDPEQMRAMLAKHLKEQLKATDEEAKVIEPLITDIMEKTREARSSSLRGMFGGSRGGDNQGTPEEQALKTTVDSTSASNSDIETKLKALRESKKAKEASLKEAREKLRKVVTLRQEALLVMMGVLD